MAVIDELKILVTAEVNKAISDLNKTEQQTKKTGAGFSSMAKQIAGYTTAANLAVDITKKIASGAVGLAKESLNLAASFEMAEISWGVLVGDMERGTAIFEELRSFAAKTPLTFEAVEKSAQTLKGFGVATEDLIPTLSKLGDVARGDNQKLSQLALVYGQVAAQGKAMTQDLYQFVNAGVPIFNMLADSLGITAGEIKELTADGKIGFKEIEAAINGATSQGGLFFGMMDKTADTLSGKWSTAQDNFNNLLAKLGKAVIPTVNAALDSFNEMFETDTLEDYTAALDKSNRVRKAAADAIAKATDPRAKSALQSIVDAEVERGNQLGRTIQYLQTIKLIEEEVTKEKKDQEEKDKALVRSSEARAAHDRASIGMIDRMKSDAAEKEMEAAKRQYEFDKKVAEKAVNASERLKEVAKQNQDAITDYMKKQADERGKIALAQAQAESEILKKEAENRKAIEDRKNAAIIDGYQNVAEAFGASIVSGEEGWKILGRAGLNAVAGIIEAMAMEADVLIASNIAKVASGQFWATPGIGAAIAASVTAHTAAGAVRAIPMAEGGMGTVTKPTLFLAGEAGPEDFAFGPKRKGGLSGGGIVVNQFIGGSVVAERNLKSMAVGAVARAGRGY